MFQPMTTLCNALQKAEVSEFVRGSIKSGYQQFFVEHSEHILTMIDNAFDRLVQSQANGVNGDNLVETAHDLAKSAFKKGDDSFWFNQAYLHYKINIQPDINFRQFKEFIIGDTILDFGCGGGYLALEMEKNGYKVLTADVMDYRFSEARHIPFVKMVSPIEIPLTIKSVGTVVAQTVLHHVDGENIPTILNALNKISTRLLLKEDTFNLPPTLMAQQNALNQPLLHSFTHLSLESQFQVIALTDYFSNAIALGIPEMNLPFQFKSVPEWEKLLRASGWQVTEVKLTGFEEHRMHKSCQAWLICDRLNPIG